MFAHTPARLHIYETFAWGWIHAFAAANGDGGGICVCFWQQRNFSGRERLVEYVSTSQPIGIADNMYVCVPPV